jgi:AmiR/NasT family two-component response regulator
MPLKVLIAEDETLIAFDLAHVVEEAGHIVVGAMC